MGLKVTITPQSQEGDILGPPVVLCDGPDPLPTYNVRINGRPRLDTLEYLDAGYVQIFAGGLRKADFSFMVTQNNQGGVAFTSPAVALAYALDRCGSIQDGPHFGLVKIEMSDGSGSIVRFLDRAGVMSTELPRFSGVKLTFQYHIIGGQLLKAIDPT